MREGFKPAGWMVLLLACALPGMAVAQATSEAQVTYEVVNTATADYDDDGGPGVQKAGPTSNTVVATVVGPALALQLYNDPAMTNAPNAVDTGDDLYARAWLRGCSHDAEVNHTIQLTIRSLTSGDSEVYTLHETTETSLTFVSQEPINTIRVTGPVTPNNHWLELWGEDELEAEVHNCAGVAIDRILIDPDGIVFDSRTNLPIAGAQVHLVDVTGAGNGGHPGEDAVVYDFDQVTQLVPTQVTGADGRFQFPFVPESEYRLDITPPGDYVYPSKVPADQLVQTRRIHTSGSFGGDFSVNTATGPVTLDIPLDGRSDGLVIEKKASRSTVEIAESLEYSINMRNISGVQLTGMTLHDVLPPGFTYVANSARVDKTPIADPAGGKGPTLDFAIPDFTGDANVTLTYRVAVGPGAAQGDATNRARLTSRAPEVKTSNWSSVKVDVDGGVFDDRAYVMGRVFADCNKNGLLDDGEAGIPRVRLYMEDGTNVITDAQGRYSFYGVVPRTHVLKVDATTLPEGVKLAAISHRNANRGDSLFLDVQKSELHRADFATDGCGEQLAAQLAARTDKTNRELDGVKTALRADATAVGDVRSLPSVGTLGDAGLTPVSLPLLAANGADAIAAKVGRTDLKTLMPTLEPWLGFVDLYDGAEVGTTELTVRIKGRTGTMIRLMVNGEPVGYDRIGLKLEDDVRLVQATEYVGVTLHAGQNTLSLAQQDDNGHFKEMVAIQVVAPGVIAHVKVTTPTEGIPADGEHLGMVRVSVVDADGVKVTSRTPVTLETTGGEWSVVDLDRKVPGVQVFIEGGEASFGLHSLTTGTVHVRASTGDFEDKGEFAFVSALRPMIVSGLVEGTFAVQNLGRDALSRARSGDGFEQELVNWGVGNKNNAGGRAALFLKGKIKGDYLLTLGYDSDKDTQTRLFRDIEPDKFYPVYGDGSIRGYDAQTTGKLYVRVERNRSYLHGGDFATQSLTQARLLGAYNRSMTGVKEHFENDNAAVEVFASHDSTRQVVDEIPGNGTSGPFALSNPNLLENSELVEVLTRSRNQPSIILAATVRRRYIDYDLEPFTGRLLFRAPIPSVTADLDPVSVRITYEVEQGGESFWTAGVDSRVKVTEHLEVGASYVDDENPQDQRKIGGANATLKFGKTVVIAEAARTESVKSDGDLGTRFEVKHDGDSLQLRAYGVKTDENFDNPSAGFLADRTEAGAKAGWSISERTRLVGEALYSEAGSTGAAREGALVGVQRSFAGNTKVEVGVRHVIDDPETGAETDTTSARVAVTTPMPGVHNLSVSGEYEQDLANSDARIAALGGEYRIADRARLYARHEFISSLTGPYALDPAQKHNTTVFGIDSKYWQDDAIFSEYRVGDSLTGRDAQAAVGLRNVWSLAEGLRLGTSFERTEALAGPTTNDSTAVTAALEYTRDPRWKASGRIELRDGDASDGLLSTFGVARKLNDDWTLLAKTVYSYIDNEVGEDRRQARAQTGVAWRSSSNFINALGRYEFKREEGVEAGLDRIVHIVSMHADLQQTARLAYRAQVATKFVEETYYGVDREDGATLVAGRITYDIAKRWDVGLHLRSLFGRSGGAQAGVGAEVGFLVTDNLWLSGGLNYLGFRDDDLVTDEYTTRGAYIRLRFKFDESSLP